MITKIKKNQQVMVPIHIKITEEMRDLLTQVAKSHGFPRIQGLIRLYIRRGLDAENEGVAHRARLSPGETDAEQEPIEASGTR